MKKALVAANLGGFASFLISDIEILQNMGYEVHYMANCDTLPWADTREKLVKMNVHIINVNVDSKNPFKITNLKEYKNIQQIIKEQKYDLIHCHTPIIGLLIRLAARKLNTKVIYTTHGFSFNSSSSKKSWLVYYNLENFASRFCDAIITINKEDFVNAKKMHCKNVYYINGVGVDIEKFKNTKINIQKYKQKIGIPNNKIVILSVGELSDRKNHQAIIRAISLIENKEDYIYVICGNGIDGGTGLKLQELAKELNVNVLLLGFRKDIPEIMKCSDIGAIPSVREGLGLAGIQSLASGVPLVASNVQGIKDYVINGKTGYLCNPFDYTRLSEAIVKLSDLKSRQLMKDECIEMSSKFALPISKLQREKIYSNLLVEEKNEEE